MLNLIIHTVLQCMSFELGFPYSFGSFEYSKCFVLFIVKREIGCIFLTLKCYDVNKVSKVSVKRNKKH